MDFYGTIGPACAELSTLQQMVRAGMTGLRMNLSHGSLAEHADWLELIRKAGVRTLLIDLQGPELRIGRLASPLTLSEGQQVFLGTGGIPCPACLLDAITPGQKLLLDDGKLLLRVNAVDTALHCTVLRGGLLQSRKSIAVPGVEVPSPTLTDEDLQNLRVAASCGVTGVMLPCGPRWKMPTPGRSRSLPKLRTLPVSVRCRSFCRWWIRSLSPGAIWATPCPCGSCPAARSS